MKITNVQNTHTNLFQFLFFQDDGIPEIDFEESTRCGPKVHNIYQFVNQLLQQAQVPIYHWFASQ
jgi:hypothetical protein